LKLAGGASRYAGAAGTFGFVYLVPTLQLASKHVMPVVASNTLRFTDFISTLTQLLAAAFLKTRAGLLFNCAASRCKAAKQGKPDTPDSFTNRNSHVQFCLPLIFLCG
jgi:hypothetical protein